MTHSEKKWTRGNGLRVRLKRTSEGGREKDRGKGKSCRMDRRRDEHWFLNSISDVHHLPSTGHVHQRTHSRSVFAWRGRDIFMFMLSHRHLLRQCGRPKILQSFSSTPRVGFPAQTQREGEEQGEGDRSVPKDPPWAAWKKTVGRQFEKPNRPCNWLGGKVVEFVFVWY